MFIKQLRISFFALLLFSVVLGLLYPAVVTLVAQTVFSDKANGSVIQDNGKIVGSRLVGQQFDDPKYFWGRLSATGGVPYNAAASSGSNLGPVNPALFDAVNSRITALREADPTNSLPIPVDLVTASGSGLDPHITEAAARYQLSRVARIRGIDESKVESLIKEYTTGRFLGVFGEPTVNVLELNLALDRN